MPYEGDNTLCSEEFHELMHEDGFVSTKPGHDPNGPYPNDDIRHDLNPDLIMNYAGVPDNFGPCVEATIDRQPQSVNDLAHDAIGFITRLDKASIAGEAIDCVPAHKDQEICYYSPRRRGKMVGSLIKIKSKFTHDR